jgi:hypothetical protein
MADKIVAEYTVKVDGALKNLDKLAARVDNIDKERKQTQKGFKEMSSSLSSSFAKVGAAIGVAFGTQQIVQFGKEAVTLASQLEGVERAFKRIGGANSANLLQGLRKATRGTVSDLVLMQKAVQASNFKIPLENLASLFKFAQARARETGESVEYLTNSIVLGIGRKSPLILDNLGISAVELRTRLKGVGVEAANVGDIAAIIGDIAEEELAKMGDQADTTADKIAQLNTKIENSKTVIGEALVSAVEGAVTSLTKLDDTIDSVGVGLDDIISKEDALNIISKITEKTVDGFTATTRLTVEATKELVKELAKLYPEMDEVFGLTKLLNIIFPDVNENMEETTSIAEGLAGAFAFMKGQMGGEGGGVINNIVRLNNQLKELKKDLSEAAIGGSEFFDITEDIADKTKELNEAIAQTKLQDAFKLDSDDPFSAIGDGLVEYEDGVERSTSIADDLWNEHFSQLMANQDADFENEKMNRELSNEIAQESLSSLSSLFSSISQIQRNAFQEEQNLLQEQLEQGLITREEFDEKTKEIRRKQAAAEKDAAIFQAVIATSQAVMQALANTPPPESYALAAVAGALGAAQIAAIASQPLPQFAEGGWVDEKTGKIHGRSHAHGGVKIEAEGNEFITKGKYAKPNAAILEAINTGDWEKYKMENIITPAINQVLDGGFSGLGGSATLNSAFNDKNLLRGTDRLRDSNKQGFIYLGDRLERVLKSRVSRWN